MRFVGISMEYTKLKSINEYKSESINPMKYPDTIFELYSVPIYETGHPEYLLGSDIGSNKVLVRKNDILLCKINPRINRVWVVTDESDHQNIASSEWIVIRNNEYNPDYLAWYFRSPRFKKLMVSEVTGIGGSLTRAQPKAVAEYPVPVLPRMEQDKIVVILDKANQIIQTRNKELQRLDDLIKARFVEMFGDLADPACKWEKCRLVDACVNSDDIKCGPFGTQLGKEEYTEEGVAVWEIPQINSEFKTFPTHFVTEKKAKELEAYSIIPGDIAMSRKGNVGRCAVFPSTLESGIIHSDVLRIRLDETKAFPEFMMRQLHYSGDIQHQIELVSSGAIMAGINVTKLKQIFVYLPPINLQDEFVATVAQVDKSKDAVQRGLDKLETLKKALMQEYFG